MIQRSLHPLEQRVFKISRQTTTSLLAGCLAAGLIGAGIHGQVARAAGASSTSAASADAALSPKRLERISRRYLGVPYKLDCLGEGKGPDPDPLFTRKYADCQTLVEQVMAEAVQGEAGGMDRAIRIIRYRDGDVALEHRFHYCIPDWLEHPWPVRDVTDEVGGTHVRQTTRTIDRAALLHTRGLSGPAAELPAETVKTSYIPRAEASGILKRIPDGSIVVFVLDRRDIVAGHMGFVFMRGGVPVLRQASQTRHRVIDEPLAEYLARAPKRFTGIKVLQPNMRGLQRKG